MYGGLRVACCVTRYGSGEPCGPPAASRCSRAARVRAPSRGDPPLNFRSRGIAQLLWAQQLTSKSGHKIDGMAVPEAIALAVKHFENRYPDHTFKGVDIIETSTNTSCGTLRNKELIVKIEVR